MDKRMVLGGGFQNRGRRPVRRQVGVSEAKLNAQRQWEEDAQKQRQCSTLRQPQEVWLERRESGEEDGGAAAAQSRPCAGVRNARR